MSTKIIITHSGQFAAHCVKQFCISPLVFSSLVLNLVSIKTEPCEFDSFITLCVFICKTTGLTRSVFLKLNVRLNHLVWVQEVSALGPERCQWCWLEDHVLGNDNSHTSFHLYFLRWPEDSYFCLRITWKPSQFRILDRQALSTWKKVQLKLYF